MFPARASAILARADSTAPPGGDRLLTTRLHGHHVLGESERQLNDLEQRLVYAFDWLDADAERKQEDVEPGDEEGDRPAHDPQAHEPHERPQHTRAQVRHRMTSRGGWKHKVARAVA